MDLFGKVAGIVVHDKLVPHNERRADRVINFNKRSDRYVVPEGFASSGFGALLLGPPAFSRSICIRRCAFCGRDRLRPPPSGAAGSQAASYQVELEPGLRAPASRRQQAARLAEAREPEALPPAHRRPAGIPDPGALLCRSSHRYYAQRRDRRALREIFSLFLSLICLGEVERPLLRPLLAFLSTIATTFVVDGSTTTTRDPTARSGSP